jgi:cysteine desulfurase
MSALASPTGAAERSPAAFPHGAEVPIYLDNLATTRLAPEARAAMIPWLDECYGNAASSTHAYGWAAADAVEQARDDVARLLGVRMSSKVVFTSGATESNNTVLKGVYEAFRQQDVHVITTAIEHPSILAPCEAIARKGASITLVRPGRDGVVDPEEIRRAIRPTTRLISVMAANNEVGTVQPIDEIGRLARSRDVLFHVDAAQAVAKIDVDIATCCIDFLSVSAHKLHGPQGIGALYMAAEGLPALLDGGGQELDRRAGTLPIAQVVGFGAAATVAEQRWRRDALHARALSTALWQRLCASTDGVSLNGCPSRRLPGCLNLSVDSVDAGALLTALPGLALSTGSACSSHSGGSHVLRAMRLPAERQRSALRIGIARFTTLDEVVAAADMIADAIVGIRARRWS